MRSLATLALSLLACGCAAVRSHPLPVCDGRHLRPANPYGSVLTADAPAAPPRSAPATGPTTAQASGPDTVGETAAAASAPDIKSLRAPKRSGSLLARHKGCGQ